MLKITLSQQSGPKTIKLEGKLSGPWVGELQRVWDNFRRAEPSSSVVIDLSEVTFINSEGMRLLKSMFQQGADLRSGAVMTTFILDPIKQQSREVWAMTNGG
jgi:anti-anti-sigma regulatory factor